MSKDTVLIAIYQLTGIFIPCCTRSTREILPLLHNYMYKVEEFILVITLK